MKIKTFLEAFGVKMRRFPIAHRLPIKNKGRIKDPAKINIKILQLYFFSSKKRPFKSDTQKRSHHRRRNKFTYSDRPRHKIH